LTTEPGESGCKDVKPAPESLPGAESVVYRTASNRPLRLFIFRPKNQGATPLRTVLFYFGGGWRSGSVASFADQAQAFAANGYVAVLADYRVSCRDGTTPLSAVSDARAAYKWLRKHAGEVGVDPTQIVLSGGAAGGQLALVTAMEARPENKPTALILFNPVVDLVTSARWYLKPLAQQISPSALSMVGLPPTLILHGEMDRRVPIDSVRAFCDQASKAGAVCTVRAYPGEDHGFYHRRTVLPIKAADGSVAASHDPAMHDVGQASARAGGAGNGALPPFDDTTARALAFLRHPVAPM
jgi:acetyl esterase/lipase